VANATQNGKESKSYIHLNFTDSNEE